MYKYRNVTRHSPEHYLNPLRFCFPARVDNFGSDKLTKNSLQVSMCFFFFVNSPKVTFSEISLTQNSSIPPHFCHPPLLFFIAFIPPDTTLDIYIFNSMFSPGRLLSGENMSLIPGQGHLPQIADPIQPLVRAHVGGNQLMCLSHVDVSFYLQVRIF